MIKVSAVINARNEEQNIKLCLQSVEWCDEIIVVDMESEDRTVEIARQFTDKIFNHPKVLAFDIARKFATDQASGDWILLVDADELVPKSLADTLRRISLQDDVDIVSIPFKTYMLGEWIRHTGWWPEYHPRFFRRGSLTFTEAVHAFITESPGARHIRLEPRTENAIAHFAYLDSEHFINKLNRYTTIEAVQMRGSGRRFSLFRMLVAGFRGFQVRYVTQRGYLDGLRGFFLSVMMGFYRALTYIKLWEAWEYGDKTVAEAYLELKQDIVNGYIR